MVSLVIISNGIFLLFLNITNYGSMTIRKLDWKLKLVP
jgi:hypothetical protein